MILMTLFKRLVARASADPVPERRTVIHTADFDRPPRGQIITDLTEQTIRANEGESWQPPPPARRDPWRPRMHW